MPEAVAVGRLVGYWSTFDELSARDLYDLLKLRQDIFIVEQTCPYGDIDGKDPGALHYRLVDHAGGQLVGAIRVLLAQSEGDGSRIGRVVVHRDYRDGGRGRALMQAGLDKLGQLAPGKPVHLSAQAHLEDFYSSLGFERCSEEYLEDGIPHVDMVRQG